LSFTYGVSARNDDSVEPMSQPLPPPEEVPGMEPFAEAARRSRRPSALERTPQFRVGLCAPDGTVCAQVILHGHFELAPFAAEMVRLGYAPLRLSEGQEKFGCDLVYAPDPSLGGRMRD
jgi:hypothetical protein